MSKMSDGGKGSSPRPFTDKNQFDQNFAAIFGESKLERKKREEALQKMVEESERLGLYDDFDVEDPDPDKRSWYYDDYGIKRKK